MEYVVSINESLLKSNRHSCRRRNRSVRVAIGNSVRQSVLSRGRGEDGRCTDPGEIIFVFKVFAESIWFAHVPFADVVDSINLLL